MIAEVKKATCYTHELFNRSEISCSRHVSCVERRGEDESVSCGPARGMNSFYSFILIPRILLNKCHAVIYAPWSCRWGAWRHVKIFIPLLHVFSYVISPFLEVQRDCLQEHATERSKVRELRFKRRQIWNKISTDGQATLHNRIACVHSSIQLYENDSISHPLF